LIRIVILVLGVIGSLAAAFAQPARTCQSLKSLTLTDATIILAESVPTGAFQPPDGQAPAQAGRGGPVTPPVELPAHCRIALVLTPSATPISKAKSGCPIWIGTANSKK